jgi:hypothetical protein
MKLRTFAERIGVRYETAWRWFKAGKIKGRQLDIGTIIITEDTDQPTQPDVIVVVYAVSLLMRTDLTWTHKQSGYPPTVRQRVGRFIKSSKRLVQASTTGARNCLLSWLTPPLRLLW